jgi:hypothetical protein
MRDQGSDRVRDLTLDNHLGGAETAAKNEDAKHKEKGRDEPPEGHDRTIPQRY